MRNNLADVKCNTQNDDLNNADWNGPPKNIVTVPKLPLDTQSSSQPPSGAPLQQSDSTAQAVSTVPNADRTEEDEGDGDEPDPLPGLDTQDHAG